MVPGAGDCIMDGSGFVSLAVWSFVCEHVCAGKDQDHRDWSYMFIETLGTGEDIIGKRVGDG